MPKKKLSLVDTNVILRFLLEDHPTQASQAKTWFNQALPKSLVLPDAVLLEIGYVLLSVYQVPKVRVSRLLSSIVADKVFVLDYQLMNLTLSIFAQQTLSLIDAYLLAQMKMGRAEIGRAHV